MRARGRLTRDDALQLGDQTETAQGLLVGGDDVLRTPRVLEPGVLGSNSGVVESRADRVRLDDLTSLGLEDVRPNTVQDTRLALG